MTLTWACETFATVDEFFACECDCAVDPENAAHVTLVQAALEAASDQLALMSAHTVRGLCRQVFTACVERCGCRGACGCTNLDIIRLPGPIVAVSGIEETEADTWDYTYDPTDFVLVDDDGIAWAPGSELRWPGGVMIDFDITYGNPIDAISKDAAIELACAALKKCLADACRNLGPNPGTVSRQGLTITKQAVSALANVKGIAAGQYPWMAKFLSTYNPEGAVVAPWIWSPDAQELVVLRPIP